MSSGADQWPYTVLVSLARHVAYNFRPLHNDVPEMPAPMITTVDRVKSLFPTLREVRVSAIMKRSDGDREKSIL